MKEGYNLYWKPRVGGLLPARPWSRSHQVVLVKISQDCIVRNKDILQLFKIIFPVTNASTAALPCCPFSWCLGGD